MAGDLHRGGTASGVPAVVPPVSVWRRSGARVSIRPPGVKLVPRAAHLRMGELSIPEFRPKLLAPPSRAGLRTIRCVQG